MKLKSLASKPQLQQLVIDDPALVEKYGEALEFYVLDRLPLETYGKLASLDNTDITSLYTAVKDLILDEDGSPVIDGEFTLPMDLMNAAIVKVTEQLGK